MPEVQESYNSGEMAQRFVQFVMVHAQNILFVLGKIPTPEGVTMPPNLQAAKILIDQLEMIKTKTKGNLNRQETKILDDTLSNVQLAFVEASGGTPASMMPSHSYETEMPEIEEETDAEASESSSASSSPSQPTQKPSPPSSEDENKKKFYKSYG